MKQEIFKEEIYDILQNNEGAFLFCVRTREGEPENPYIEYDGGADALYYRRPGQVIWLDEVHPDTRQGLVAAKEVLFAEFIPKSEQTSQEEAGIIREYMVEVRKVDKVPELIEEDMDEDIDFLDELGDNDPELAGDRVRAMIADNPEMARRAVAFYTEMANDGNIEAMYELGMLYWEGVGVEYDYGKAREWIEKAAAQGSEKALESLADLEEDDGRYDPYI